MLHTNRLIGLVGNEMPVYGLLKAEVKIGDFIAEDELVVADDLSPEKHFRLKFVVENKCLLDVVERNFTDLKEADSTVEVPLSIGGRLVLPPEDDKFVFETVPGPGTVLASSKTNETFEQKVDKISNLSTPVRENSGIKEQLRFLIRQNRHLFSLGTAVGIEHPIFTHLEKFY